MGKRSSFKRNPRDFYPTPLEAVTPLISHISSLGFWEPCAGDGTLTQHIINSKDGLYCVGESDIEPQATGIARADALTISPNINVGAFITNPPWDRSILHPLIENLRLQAPTWLLIDADWMHTRQSAPYIKYCQRIVSVGRVKWIPNSKMTGKDNCAWYLFDYNVAKHTSFYGRA